MFALPSTSLFRALDYLIAYKMFDVAVRRLQQWRPKLMTVNVSVSVHLMRWFKFTVLFLISCRVLGFEAGLFRSFWYLFFVHFDYLFIFDIFFLLGRLTKGWTNISIKSAQHKMRHTMLSVVILHCNFQFDATQFFKKITSFQFILLLICLFQRHTLNSVCMYLLMEIDDELESSCTCYSWN